LFASKDLYNNAQLGKFKLVDLTVIEAEQILQHKKLAVLEMVLKHIHARDFTKAIDDVVKAIVVDLEDHLSDSLLQGTFNYLFDGREKADIAQLILKLKQTIPYNKSTEEILMSYADELRQEGRQETQREIAKQLIESGVDYAIITKTTHLTVSELEKIKKNLH
jgi:predicted transposase/invertase (TIGR01784 family)